VTVVLPGVKSGYKLSYLLFGNSTDVILSKATGLVYPTYSLSEEAKKGVILETFDILGKNNLYGDKHNYLCEALGSTVALSLQIVDDYILEGTKLSVEEIYGLKR